MTYLQFAPLPAWSALRAASDLANFIASHLKKLSTGSVRAQRARSSSMISTWSFFAAFIMAQVISVGGVIVSTEMGYVIAFVIFIVLMFVRPGGIFARRA